ncbi:unnamed protein product [Calypogeia fissa]
MSRIIRQWDWVAAVVVVVIYALCAAASPCYGNRDPCSEGNVHKLSVLPTSAVSSDLLAIRIDSINIGGVRNSETISHKEAKKSAFGTPRIARKLDEEDVNLGEGVGTPGMRLSLSRRSSHPSSSEADMHPVESLQRSMKRDFYRVNGFVKRILSTAQPKEQASYMRSNFREGFPDLTHPGGRKDQPTDQSASLNSSSGLYKFESTVKSGVPFGSGEYFMDFYVGTPPRHFSVIIDTGSDLTWVQCDPCSLCYHQDGPVFQPNMSSTYEGLTCNAENCKSAGGFGDDPNRCQETTKEPGLCRDDPSYIGSPLIFGEDEIYKVLQPRFQWTPLLKNTPVDTFYYVNITGVSVGGELVKIPETAWQVDMDGYGGTIIDSGTTLSYFRQEAYDAIKKAFVDRISYPMVTTVPVLSLCYDVSGVQSPDFPSLSIIFKGNAVMDLPFKNYFIRPDPAAHVYCLALLGMPQKSLNIIGNFQQQNFHMVFDRGNFRLGFAPMDCTSIL